MISFISKTGLTFINPNEILYIMPENAIMLLVAFKNNTQRRFAFVNQEQMNIALKHFEEMLLTKKGA